ICRTLRRRRERQARPERLTDQARHFRPARPACCAATPPRLYFACCLQAVPVLLLRCGQGGERDPSRDSSPNRVRRPSWLRVGESGARGRWTRAAYPSIAASLWLLQSGSGNSATRRTVLLLRDPRRRGAGLLLRAMGKLMGTPFRVRQKLS